MIGYSRLNGHNDTTSALSKQFHIPEMSPNLSPIFSLSPSFGLTDSSRSVVELREEGHSSLYPEILWFV